MTELSRSDEMSLAGAALRGAPWKLAAFTGGGVAAVNMLIGLVFSGADPGGALSLGAGLFFIVAAAGALFNPGASGIDRVTRNARAWSLKHPWRFALLPAAATAAVTYPIQLILDGEGIFGSLFDALWGGALVYLVVGLLGVAVKGRARNS
ncbi:hypothetical protein [Rhizohabitans arisaemae]|uniref:hypothetical protein n=1 Tax=Rhizohabitans arisaemae TaxID=2720610 RepID=UPI0024B24EA0|nr:hypothetical protein [Rhizohabitans arisaemae]